MHPCFGVPKMTQQVCIVQNLSVEKQNHRIFSLLNFSLTYGQLSGLIGRNGQGKSILLSTLNQPNQKIEHIYGQIHWHAPFAFLSQHDRTHATTIAEALNIHEIINALNRIEMGESSPSDFEILENNWHIREQWAEQLSAANLPNDFQYLVENLSEGQKTKLALCKLFSLKDHYLLLDEPSNHLDLESRDWFIQCLLKHPAGAFIASHDTNLLNHMQHIYALNQFGIQHYLGDYAHYIKQNDLQIEALERKFSNEKSALQQIKVQQNDTRLKADKRSTAGKSARGSQAKILLDAKKNASEKSQKRLNIQQNNQTEHLQQSIAEHRRQIEVIKPQSFDFEFSSNKTGEILRIKQLKLSHGTQIPIDFALNAQDKIHLLGVNGIGKSTFLKTLAALKFNDRAEIDSKANIVYLDQTLCEIFPDPELSILSHLNQINPEMSAQEWRNQLGRLRIRLDKSLLRINQLSGGERLKVALLALSKSHHQVDLLLLDEPENHLDIESKDLLAAAIRSFKGAVILVSHDQHFVENCHIKSSFMIE